MRAEVTAMRFMLVLPLMLMGCATAPSPQAVAVRDADQKMVESCEFVGDVTGASGWGGIAASVGTKNAQNEARDQAAGLGATHVVWSALAGGWSPSVSGKAYRCNASA